MAGEPAGHGAAVAAGAAVEGREQVRERRPIGVLPVAILVGGPGIGTGDEQPLAERPGRLGTVDGVLRPHQTGGLIGDGSVAVVGEAYRRTAAGVERAPRRTAELAAGEPLRDAVLTGEAAEVAILAELDLAVAAVDLDGRDVGLAGRRLASLQRRGDTLHQLVDGHRAAAVVVAGTTTERVAVAHRRGRCGERQDQQREHWKGSHLSSYVVMLKIHAFCCANRCGGVRSYSSWAIK
jgi:hypothetical protein